MRSANPQISPETISRLLIRISRKSVTTAIVSMVSSVRYAMSPIHHLSCHFVNRIIATPIWFVHNFSKIRLYLSYFHKNLQNEMPYRSTNPLNPRIPTVKRLIGLIPTAAIMSCAARNLFTTLNPIAPSPILTPKYKSACPRRFRSTIKSTTPQIPAIAKNEYGFSTNLDILLFSDSFAPHHMRYTHANRFVAYLCGVTMPYDSLISVFLYRNGFYCQYSEYNSLST